jgi:hypothetical protein
MASLSWAQRRQRYTVWATYPPIGMSSAPPFAARLNGATSGIAIVASNFKT